MTAPVPADPTVGLKSGIKSSEFWLVLLTFAADGSVAFTHVDLTKYVPLVAVVLAHIVGLLYVVGRVALKFKFPSSLKSVKGDFSLVSSAKADVELVLADIKAHASELEQLVATVKADVAARKTPVKVVPVKTPTG